MSNQKKLFDVLATLRRPDELFEEVEAMAGIGYWEWDEIGDNCTYCSEQLARMHGVTVQEFMAKATSMDADLEWVHPDDRERYRATTMKLRRTRGIVELEYRIIKTGGGEIHVRERGVAVTDRDGVHIRSYGFIQDITNLKAAELALLDLHQRQEELLERRTQDLRRSEQRYAFALSGSQQGVWEWDLQTNNNYLSSEWKAILGYREEELPNEPGTFARLIHPDDLPAVEDAIRAHLQQRVPFDIDHRMIHKDGSAIWIRARGHAVWDEDNRPVKMGGTISDISEYRKLLESARYNAERDQLTGLYNRHYLMGNADNLLNNGHSHCACCGVAILDLDGFKEINDSHGHPAGDSALVVIAGRLARHVGDKGIVIRLGGDEFAIVYCLSQDWAATETFFEELVEEIAKPIGWQGFLFECTASVGVAVKGAGNGACASDLLQQADLALYASKATGGNVIRRYTEDLLQAALNRTNVLSSARRALAEDRFILHYQPKVDLTSRRLAGFEALLRLVREDGTLASPCEYAEVFQDSVLACRIGETVHRRTIEQAAAWTKDGFDFGHIAFNISAPEFQAYQRDCRFVDTLLKAIAGAGIKPRNIHVEVTEDVLLTTGGKPVSDILRRLRENGVKVALDDFGTGHASLIHLKEAEFDLIKLDISFVQSMLTSNVDMSIVETICTLAEKLGKPVVAEGIETAQQLEMLKELGVSFGQGFLIGEPLAADAARAAAGELFLAGGARQASVENTSA